MFSKKAGFVLSWYEKNCHALRFEKTGEESGWHVCHSPAGREIPRISVSIIIADWLKSRDVDVTQIRWYTATGWLNKSLKWRSTPI